MVWDFGGIANFIDAGVGVWQPTVLGGSATGDLVSRSSLRIFIDGVGIGTDGSSSTKLA